MSDEGLIQTKAGQAHSEDGLVVLDGPDGIAVTMTAEAGTVRISVCGRA